MHHSRLTFSKGSVKAQCTCGAQSLRVNNSPGGWIALRVWKIAHRVVMG